jgi:alpha-1,6-mannosyltransferase
MQHLMNHSTTPHIADITMFWAPQSGGVRRYIEQKHKWLRAARQWNCSVVAPVSTGLSETVVKHAIAFSKRNGYRLPLSRNAGTAALLELAPSLIEAGDPYRLAWSALDAARTLCVPAVAFCHSDIGVLAEHSAGASAKKLADRYLKHVYERFDLVLAPSRHMVNRLQSIKVENVEHQALGVDTAAFQPIADRLEWRRLNGFSDDARIVIYVGRFSKEKNLDVAAQAVKMLGPPYVLLAIGAGAAPPAGDAVRLHDFECSSQALARAISAADVFVHCGDQETFGLSVLESLACGTPVVNLAHAGLAELTDDRTGCPVNRLDAAEFASALEAVCNRGRDAYMQAARQRALGYDWNVVLPELHSKYKRLLDASSVKLAA